MILDTELSPKLQARLTGLIDSSKDTLVGALEHREYTLACGMIEAWKQVRDGLIPELLDAIQKR